LHLAGKHEPHRQDFLLKPARLRVISVSIDFLSMLLTGMMSFPPAS
jgi:hypothetical protein